MYYKFETKFKLLYDNLYSNNTHKCIIIIFDFSFSQEEMLHVKQHQF
jgi:hypothetical protein